MAGEIFITFLFIQAFLFTLLIPFTTSTLFHGALPPFFKPELPLINGPHLLPAHDTPGFPPDDPYYLQPKYVPPPPPKYSHRKPYHSPLRTTPLKTYPAYEYVGYQPAVVHHYPALSPYEKPKHNCSVEEIIEEAAVCTPDLERECVDESTPIKVVTSKSQCYTTTRTVCTVSDENIDNEVCEYKYQNRIEVTTAKTVDIEFSRECDTQMVTVCEPAGYGPKPLYGYAKHGHISEHYCKEVAQETCSNIPILKIIEPTVEVTYPEPTKSCTNRPIHLPRISCEDISAERCIDVPEVKDSSELIRKCSTTISPSCQGADLMLPKQVCNELNFGHVDPYKI